MPAKTAGTARKPKAPADPRLLAEVRLATRECPEGLPLKLPEGIPVDEARAAVASAMANQALRWTYVLRSRRRWVDDTRSRERNEQEAREALQAIGVDEAMLATLAQSDCVVVRIPYRSESERWEARVFPWEYVLAAATRERRVQKAASGRPQPLTVMRELQRQPLHEPTGTAALFAAGITALFVECLPSELREHWTLDSERKRVQAALPEGTQWHVLSYPTLEELRGELATRKPQLVHFAGVDSHQGLRELRTYVGVAALVDIGLPEPQRLQPSPQQGQQAQPQSGPTLVDEVIANRRLMVDGVLLRGDSGYPRLVRAHELATTMLASGHQAFFVGFNLWNTAARVAPLVVAEGAALAAAGYQDVFEDALAEFVQATLLQQLVAQAWNLPAAFDATWRIVRELPESTNATGVTLWAADPLLPNKGLSWQRAAAAAPSAEGPAPSARRPPPKVSCDIKPHRELNYAVLHNAQPLFEKFLLECDQPGEGVTVDVEVAVHMGHETACFRRRVVMDKRRIALADKIHVPLTAEVVRTVREAISSSLEVTVQHGERMLYRDTHRLRLLPVDQWRDNRRDGRWLPSFVQPRDPAVARALEQAQRYNRVLRDDPSAGFEGYQLARPDDEDSLRSVDRQVEAIWATLLHDWQLGYINPPPTYSGTLDSQRLRMPSSVLQHRAGTCIDLALLFAACLELVDIYPVIFLLEGHALPGWWRHPTFRDEYFAMPADNFAEIVQADARENSAANAQTVAWHTGKASWLEVRRWIRERKLVPIETVRLTEHCGFVEAIEAGVEALSEQRDFDSMLEIVTARTEQVTPLPLLREVS